MEFQLVLVRHGYSLGNEKSLFSGWSDVPLTERGRRELRELPRDLFWLIGKPSWYTGGLYAFFPGLAGRAPHP